MFDAISDTRRIDAMTSGGRGLTLGTIVPLARTKFLGWFTRFALSAMMPRTDTIKGVADTNLGPFLKKFRKEAPFLLRLALGASSFVFVISPLFTLFLPLPAFFLSAKLKDRHAQKLAYHGNYLLRQSAFMLKMIAALSWASDDEVRTQLGLPLLPPDPGTWRQGT